MFVRVKSTPNSPRRSVQIVESRRRGNKVSQVILRHVGIALDASEQGELRRLAETIMARMEAEQSHPLPLFSAEDAVYKKSKRAAPATHPARPISG